MGYECFDVEVNDRVAHLRMIRPETHNSMVPSFWRELPEIVDRLSASGEARALVLSSEGKHFSSGMDLAVFANSDNVGQSGSGHRSRKAERFRSTALQLQESFTALERARMPVLAAVSGACVGGGIDMICAADLRYADETAFFSIAEINIGMTADVGTLQRMPRLVPEGIVRELAYTGRRWSAAEAHGAGFVNAVHADKDTLLEAVMATAAEIATKSPMAIWGTKRSIEHARDHSVADGLEFIANWNASMLDPDDMAEAFGAQAEGRSADFPDLFPLSDGV